MTHPFTVTRGSVAFGPDRVLADVDLVIESGQFVALLGENGSGKTTLLRALLGLQPLTSGTVKAFGRPVGGFRDWHRIAYVPQHVLGEGAIPVSVAEVVSSGLTAHRPRRRRAADRAAVREALDQVGLGERRADAFHTLSGGQQRRVLAAAALVKRADVVCLDEPTAGIDEANVTALVDLLAGEQARGVTVVLVTHELGPFTPLVDRCVVLGHPNGHSVRYDGPPPPPRTLRDRHGHVEETAPPAAQPLWEAGP